MRNYIDPAAARQTALAEAPAADVRSRQVVTSCRDDPRRRFSVPLDSPPDSNLATACRRHRYRLGLIVHSRRRARR